jgi:uncharacterized repeat protein (TIGR02543 family)
MISLKKTTLSLIAATFLLGSCNGVVSEKTYNVYFFTANSGATQVDTIFDQPVGEVIERPEDPTRNGFDFIGWYLDLDKTIAWNFEEDVMPEASILLYAAWGSRILNITYNLNGGAMISEDYRTTFVPGETFVLPAARRTGYQFRGWFLYGQNLEKYPTNEGTIPGDKPFVSLPATALEDLVFYAHWSSITVVLTLRPAHPGGANVVANPPNRLIAYGTVINFGTNFPSDYGVINGYLFIGWNSRPDGSGIWYNQGEIFLRTLATTLYGQWQPV